MKIRILFREIWVSFWGTTSASGHIRGKHIGGAFFFLCELCLN